MQLEIVIPGWINTGRVITLPNIPMKFEKKKKIEDRLL